MEALLEACWSYGLLFEEHNRIKKEHTMTACLHGMGSVDQTIHLEALLQPLQHMEPNEPICYSEGQASADDTLDADSSSNDYHL